MRGRQKLDPRDPRAIRREREDPKAWMLGFELEQLKALAEPFKKAHKDLVMGFGLVKEQAVAQAMSEGRYIGQQNAAAIVSKSESPRWQKCFSRSIKIPANTLVVESLAILKAHEGMALLGLLQIADPDMVIEIFEEDALAKSCVLEAGFRWIDTKVAASSELKGIYAIGVPQLTPLDDPAEISPMCLLCPSFAGPLMLRDALDEVEDVEGYFAQHYSNYNKRGSWQALSLRGYDDDPSFIIRPDEMSKSWQKENAERMMMQPRDTPLAKQCPVLMAIAAQIPGAKDRIRLMRLQPGGGELTRHADITLRHAGVADRRIARLHVPLQTNPDVVFTQWGIRGDRLDLHFPEGCLFYLDQRKPHRAINGGQSERVHLVIDVESGHHLRSWIEEASHAYH